MSLAGKNQGVGRAALSGHSGGGGVGNLFPGLFQLLEAPASLG